jgi:hypothetical protein
MSHNCTPRFLIVLMDKIGGVGEQARHFFTGQPIGFAPLLEGVGVSTSSYLTVHKWSYPFHRFLCHYSTSGLFLLLRFL